MTNVFNWKNIVVKPSAKLGDAIKQLDSQGKRSLLVADDEYRLVGIVSDGDVRRALIRGIDLNESVTVIMQSKPIVATPQWTNARLLSCMEKYQLLFIPVVDESNHILLSLIHI